MLQIGRYVKKISDFRSINRHKKKWHAAPASGFEHFDSEIDEKPYFILIKSEGFSISFQENYTILCSRQNI